MSMSEVSWQHQQQRDTSTRTRASSYLSARERLLSRDHGSSEARNLAYQVRSSPYRKQQQQHHHRQGQTSTLTRMEHQQAPGSQQQEQPSESGSRQPVGLMGPRRSLRSLIAVTNSDRSKLSVSPASSGHEPADERPPTRSDDDDDDDLEGAQSDRDNEQAALERLRAEQLEQNKQHVGPVMGVFFKVWSLVKVTRRRHNRMRRQNSDGASQFHFISGDQLASTSGAQPSGAPAPAAIAGSRGQAHFGYGKHILQDGHFRRAGSQPPLSSHVGHSLSQQESGAHLQPFSLQGGRLRVQPGGGTNQAQSASTTNSSSSGVSSVASSSLVANEHEQKPFVQSGDRSVARRAEDDTREQQVLQRARLGQKEAGRSWTSRIKSRASSDAQQNSPDPQRRHQQQIDITRHHFRRADANLRHVHQGQAAIGLSAGGLEAGKSPRQLRSHSELQQLDELKRRPPGGTTTPASSLLKSRNRPAAGQRMRSDDSEDEDEDENTRTNDDDEIGAASDEDEDSDLNDIYSTPNDSIQSVPSTQLLVEQRRASSTALSQPVYPIVKSFSSQNFSQIARPQQAVGANHETIDERAEPKSSSSSSASSKTTTNNNSNHQIDSIADGPNGRQKGSHFFMCSSSSEESQTNSSSAKQAQVDGKLLGPTAARVPDSAGQQVQIPIHFGRHLHEDHVNSLGVGADARPSSLILAPPTTSILNHQQPPLVTPCAVLLGGVGPLANESAIAAMSPMLPPTQSLNQHAGIMMGQQQQQQKPPVQLLPLTSQFSAYKKSPSLFEIAHYQRGPVNLNTKTRFSSRYPTQAGQQSDESRLFGQQKGARDIDKVVPRPYRGFQVPHSISLHDCKLNQVKHDGRTPTGLRGDADGGCNLLERHLDERSSEYKLAQMLLKLGSNPSAAKDQEGCTALMHSVMSENLSAFKCLLEHGVDLNETNHQGQTALDLICSKPANDTQMEMFNMLIDNRVDFDRTRHSDGSRLLDRLIGAHVSRSPEHNKLPYIDCLLHNGAKLSSSTWLAANGKHELQLRLLRKLCQDGYFLYKKCSIEAAVYRFEYALKRIDELEQQLAHDCCRTTFARRRKLDRNKSTSFDSETTRDTQQVKYQTYLGLSRCERKRKFFRRALEFAHMSILVDSTSYEGYYSKAHILKDLGEIDDSLIAINQTERLVNKSMEHIKAQLIELQNQEESIVFDGCFQVHDPNRASWIESKRAELIDNLEYLDEAKKHISRLRCEILEEKFKHCDTITVEDDGLPTDVNQPLST